MSREMQTRFVINGDASGGIRVMRQMRDQVTGLGKDLDSSGQRSQQFGRTVQETSHQIEFLKRTALSAGVALASMFTARNLIGTADEYSQMASRIRLVTESTLEYEMVQQRLMQTSRNAYKPLMDVSELFVNTVRPIKEVGFATQDVLDLTEALAAGMVISGTKAQQSASLMDQFSKGMIQGKLQGDAYNSVVQNAPRLQQALTDALRVNTRELDRMATAGELTANKVIPALNSQVGAMVAQLEEMPTSVEDARVVFNNAWMEYIGTANEAYSATGLLASGIELAADNIETLADVGLVAGTVLAGRGVQAIGSYTMAVGRRAESERMAATEVRRRLEEEKVAATQAQRREAAEKSLILQEANRAQQRAQHSVAAARQDLERVQSSQRLMAAERVLETQRLQAQISETGRQRSLARLAEIRLSERALMGQQQAAQAALTGAIDNETRALKTASIAKADYTKATLATTPPTIAQAAGARASAVAHNTLAVALRGVAGAYRLVGGPLGLATLAASAFFLFRDSSVDVRSSLLDLDQPLDSVIEQFRTMTAEAKEAALIQWGDRYEEEAEKARTALGSIRREIAKHTGVRIFGGRDEEGHAAYLEVLAQINDVEAGVGSLHDVLVVAQESMGIPDSAMRELWEAAAAYSSGTMAAEDFAEKISAGRDEMERAANGAADLGRSIRDNTPDASTLRAWDQYNQRLRSSIANLKDASAAGAAARQLDDMGITDPIRRATTIMLAVEKDRIEQQREMQRKAEQEASAAARQSEQMASAALRKQEQERERIKGMYESQALSMQREIALHGEIGEVAKIRWELENGSLQGLRVEHRDHLLQLREELSLLERRSSLINTYVPDLERLKTLQRDSMAIESLDPGLGNLAAKQLERELGNVATRGLQVPTSLDATVSGPFGEADRLDREMERYREQYQQRLELLREFTNEEYGVKQQAQAALAELERRNIETVEQYERQSRQARLAGNASMYGDLAGLAKVFAGEQSSIYRGLFAAHKAYSMASTMVSSYQAIAQAWASAPFPANIPIVAKTVLETGALSSMLSAIQPTGMSHAGVDRIPKEGTWLLDQGQRVMMSQQADELDRFLASEKRAANDSNGGRSNVQIDVEVINQGQPVNATATVERMSDDRFKVRVLQTMREDLASGASSSYAEQFANVYGNKRRAG